VAGLDDEAVLVQLLEHLADHLPDGLQRLEVVLRLGDLLLEHLQALALGLEAAAAVDARRERARWAGGRVDGWMGG